MNRTFRTLAALAAVATVAACGGDDEPETRVDTPPPPPVETPAASAVTVSDVSLGTEVGADGSIQSAATQFGTDDTIYAVVSTTGAGSGTNLTARWTFEDGQVVDETTQTISPTGPARTEFHVSHPDEWPAGSYSVAIVMDGREVASRDFTVE